MPHKITKNPESWYAQVRLLYILCRWYQEMHNTKYKEYSARTWSLGEISIGNLNSQGESSPGTWEFSWEAVFCVVPYLIWPLKYIKNFEGKRVQGCLLAHYELSEPSDHLRPTWESEFQETSIWNKCPNDLDTNMNDFFWITHPE